MPRTKFKPLLAACALALVVSLCATTGALAKGFSANLRVVGSGGKTLTEKAVTTANTSVKTSKSASCFGPENVGSGKSVSIKGNTGLGLLARASQTTGALKPLSLTDAFDFGLGLCGVGSSVAKGSFSWYLTINHRALQVGGDAAIIHPGDDVLWALVKTSAPTYAYPNELVLSAPVKASAGKAITVRAWSYDGKGKRKPAQGVKVTGAAAKTGSDGRTTVTLRGPARLQATKTGEIPSAKVAVCVGNKCPGSG